MAISVTLTNTAINSGSPVRLLCNNVLVSGTKNNVQKPNANGVAEVEVQTQSFENLKYVIQGLNITGVAGTLTFDDIKILYKQKYDGTNASVLNISYGNDISVTSLSGATDIPVVMTEGFTVPFNVKTIRNAAIQVGSITFRETA